MLSHLDQGRLEELCPPPCGSKLCGHCSLYVHDIENCIPRPVAELIHIKKTPETILQAIPRLYGRPMTSQDWMYILLYGGVCLPLLRLLLARTNPECGDPSTLLHVYCSDIDVMDYLLGSEVRMNINLQHPSGSTVLFSFLAFYYSDKIQIDAGDAEEEEDIGEGETMLDYLLHLQRVIRPHIEYLLQRGADPLLANKHGLSPLTFVESLTRCPAEEKQALLALLQRYA